MGLGLFHSLVRVQLGEALLLDGQIEEAREMTQSGLELARKRGEQGHEAQALRILGEIAIQPDSVDNESARSNFQSALLLAEKHDMRPLQAHCHFGLGRIDNRQLSGSSQRDSIKLAITLYRELDMPAWLSKAEKNLPA